MIENVFFFFLILYFVCNSCLKISTLSSVCHTYCKQLKTVCAFLPSFIAQIICFFFGKMFVITFLLCIILV